MGRNLKLIFKELLSIFIMINTLILVILRLYTDFNLKLSKLNWINMVNFNSLAFLDNYI